MKTFIQVSNGARARTALGARIKHACIASGLIIAGLTGAPASADVLAERLPTGTHNQTSQNIDSRQNFLTQVLFKRDVYLTSMTIFTEAFDWVGVGDPTTLKVRRDVSGSPASDDLYRIYAPLTTIAPTTYSGWNGVKINAITTEVNPLFLMAGIYWVGLSGHGDFPEDTGWASYDQGDGMVPPYQAVLNGDSVLTYPVGSGTQVYIINGTAADQAGIPEPSTWAMMLLGFGVVGLATRYSTPKRSFSQRRYRSARLPRYRFLRETFCCL